MLNPEIKIAKSKGIDIPLLYIYAGGYMSGEKLHETMAWRKFLRNSYKSYDEDDEGNIVSFPLAILDPYNGGKEFKSIDQKGLTSSLSPNAIYDGDLMSVKKADIIVANIDTFGCDRPMIGTYWELGLADAMGKPFIIIAPDKKAGERLNIKTGLVEDYTFYDIATKHPFLCRASGIVKSVEQLVSEKHLIIFYRRIAGSIYE